MGAEHNQQDWALAALCWQQLAKTNVWCKECSKVTAVQAFEDHITMAKETSIYIHIYSPCKHRQITLRPETEFKGEREPFQGKLVEKVGLNTWETEVKNKHKWPEFKTNQRANTINAVKVLSLWKGENRQLLGFVSPKERKGCRPLTERHKHPSPTQNANCVTTSVHPLNRATTCKLGYWRMEYTGSA